MLKLISSFFSPPGRVNVTERDISESDISVSKRFQEEIFKFARLQITGAKSVIAIKISGIFNTTVTSKCPMNFSRMTNFLLTQLNE